MLFISLVKKALEMFMTKHNQVLVVGNSRLGKIHIPSCIACDRPLVERVRLDSVASRDSIRESRGASLGGPGIMNNSSTSHWDSDEEGGGISGTPAGGNMSFYNGQHAVGGSSVASSNRGGSTKNKGGGLLKLPSADSHRPKTGDAYVLRGGFKMPRNNDGLATSSSTSFLPDVYNN